MGVYNRPEHFGRQCFANSVYKISIERGCNSGWGFQLCD